MKLRRGGKSFPRQLTTGTESCSLLSSHVQGTFWALPWRTKRGPGTEKSGKRPKLEPYFKVIFISTA